MTSANVSGGLGPADPSVRRILLVLPNWVGDVVMATPVLAAVRARFQSAQITFLMRKYVAEIVEGGGWHDASALWSSAKGLARPLEDARLAGRMRDQGGFDLAVLMTNSLRSALVAWRSGALRRVGYAREGRSLLLTDRLKPRRADGAFVPTPLLDYYAALADRAGVPIHDRTLRLPISDEQADESRRLLTHYGFADGAAYAVLNPGAAFGAAKCWPAERFAEVAERLHSEMRMRSLVVGGPAERELMREIARRSKGGATACEEPGTTLGSLKGVIRSARLLVCNDTGPRHYGNALGVPTVTIFGPTHQEWTRVDLPTESCIQAKVECGPCQLRVCPLDHRCMREVSVDWVMRAIRSILQTTSSRDLTAKGG